MRLGTAMPTPTSPAPAKGSRTDKPLYWTDPYSWALRQAALLRQRDCERLDWENVAEEIEDLARKDRSSWTSLCARAVEHLLKMQHWGPRRPDSLRPWSREVDNFRDQMAEALDDSPGLKGVLDEMFAKAWERGRRAAAKALSRYEEDAGLDGRVARRKWLATIPEEPAFRLEEVAGKDPRQAMTPQDDELWPPAVERVLRDGRPERRPTRRRQVSGRDRSADLA